jgi:ElaB/YqjD/DUF883 family membrane-anchored ribosome-binding protein
MAETNDLRKDLADRSPEELRSDIAAQRESISQIVGKIEDKIQDRLDWKKYFSDYPYAAVGVAVGTGFLASRLLKRRPSQRLADTLLDSARSFVDRWQ